MKTPKKALAVVMCVVMMLTATPLSGFIGLDLTGLFDFKAEAATYSGSCGDNLTWVLDTDSGVLTISGTGAMEDYTSSSDIPWDSCYSSVKTVIIGDSVTTIGKKAFCVCYYLTSVKIGIFILTKRMFVAVFSG